MTSSDSSRLLRLLVAPLGQLSGDGQLRELIQERRGHAASSHGGLWYLSPALMHELGLSSGQEGLAIAEPSAAAWLQLRFGGLLQSLSVSGAWLESHALNLPAAAPLAPLRCLSLSALPRRHR
jgi:hypothetical protein